MSSTFSRILEIAARWLAVAMIGLLCWIGKDTVLQLRQIQADLVNIKMKLAVMEANAMTAETVKQIVKLELLEKK